MGLLDQVIRSALGSRSGSNKSQMVTALLALLASRYMASRAQRESSATDLGSLGGLVERFRNGGFGDIIDSWIGTGANKPISPTQLHGALGQETVDELARQSGLPRQDFLAELSTVLPGVVDKLTPHGQLPSDAELLAGPRQSDARED